MIIIKCRTFRISFGRSDYCSTMRVATQAMSEEYSDGNKGPNGTVQGCMVGYEIFWHATRHSFLLTLHSYTPGLDRCIIIQKSIYDALNLYVLSFQV
jgi:hypothetical protein